VIQPENGGFVGAGTGEFVVVEVTVGEATGEFVVVGDGLTGTIAVVGEIVNAMMGC